MAEINWSDPPLPRGKDGGVTAQIRDIYEQLKAHPGRWAFFGEYTAWGHTAYLVKTFPGLKFATRKETVGGDDGTRTQTIKVWVRYGEPAEVEPPVELLGP